MGTNFLSTLLACCMLLPTIAWGDDIVVVVNPQSGIDKLTRTEVINIYMGRYRQLPSGISAKPIDLPANHPNKVIFYHLLVNKNLSEINSYWARLTFSGRTSPPIEAKSNEEALKFISRTPGAIGYMDRSKIDARVVLVYELGP